MKKLLSIFLIILITSSLSACSWNDPQATSDDGVFKVTMVPDLGGINDQSFNQSAWEGLQKFKSEQQNVEVSYMESKQSSDFALNLDRLSDGNYDLIWGIGFSMSDAVYDTAKINLDKNYAIVDYSYGNETPNNVTGVMFRSQESAFMVGYVAAKTTKTNKIGFVGGMKNSIIYQFEYGFKAGVLYAAKEMGKGIEVVSQYAESFTDAAKGKAIASKMYSDDCDVVFHAAGGVGYGVIEAAKDKNKFAIGVDRDQSSIAPDNVLTSALKNVGQAVDLVSKRIMNGESLGGTTQTFGLKEGCVGIPVKNKNMDPQIYNETIRLSQSIVDGNIKINNKEITIPYDYPSYLEYISTFS
ncbi:MAG: Basic membrane lipoprotein A [Eubacteriales bacterium SKADARSKE-1]|nr:Basic membrane lipoprotein A [Eubacteriales bacterium SKADARSKE-1]